MNTVLFERQAEAAALRPREDEHNRLPDHDVPANILLHREFSRRERKAQVSEVSFSTRIFFYTFLFTKGDKETQISVTNLSSLYPVFSNCSHLHC